MSLIFNKGIVIKSLLLSFAIFLFNIQSSWFISKFIGVKLGKLIVFNSLEEEFFLVVIIAPIIETILFQYLIINQVYVSYNGKYKKMIAIAISAICFGLLHLYHFYYFVLATIGGFFFAYFFCYFKKTTNSISAIAYIAIIHSLSNFYVFLIKTFNLL